MHGGFSSVYCKLWARPACISEKTETPGNRPTSIGRCARASICIMQHIYSHRHELRRWVDMQSETQKEAIKRVMQYNEWLQCCNELPSSTPSGRGVHSAHCMFFSRAFCLLFSKETNAFLSATPEAEMHMLILIKLEENCKDSESTNFTPGNSRKHYRWNDAILQAPSGARSF